MRVPWLCHRLLLPVHFVSIMVDAALRCFLSLFQRKPSGVESWSAVDACLTTIAAVQAVQGAAGRMDYMLRYHSLHDNQYLRYFDGHTQPITTIAVSPKNDMFMSAAEVPPQHAGPEH